MIILITSIGATSSITAAKVFNNKKVRIIGIDLLNEYETAGRKFCDKYYTIGRFTKPDYIPRLREICAIEKVDLLIPMLDKEIEIISKNEKSFYNIKILMAPYKTVITCNDKWKAYQFFSSNNIPTPETYLNEIPENAGDNIIYKLREGIGSQGLIDHGLLYKKIPRDYIAQQKIIGQEYTIDCFCDKNGDLIYAVPRKRIEVKAGICYKGETVNNEVFLDNIYKIIKNLRFYGPFNIQVFLTPENQQYYIEINPRLGASSIITQAAGIDIGDYIIKLVNNENIEPVVEYKKVRMNRYFSEVFFYDF